MSSDTIQLLVHGAAGRMGKRVVALAAEDPQIRITAAIDHATHPAIGQDAIAMAGAKGPAVALRGDWPTTGDVVIDFSSPAALHGVIENCKRSKLSLVLATTGLEDHDKKLVAEAAKSIPVVWSPSMSLAVNLAMRLVEQATSKLKDVPGGVDIEIVERHHRYKADAPSGTALKFGELIAGQLNGDTKHVHGREGLTGQRTRNEIGYHAVRTGDDPGQHTIIFGMLGETLEIRVGASNRDCYATGAIAAAKWLRGKPAGLYSMFDVLGLNG